jgi:D-alanyl-D-alanine dipeptidase
MRSAERINDPMPIRFVHGQRANADDRVVDVQASSHSRGVAVDLTLVPIPEAQIPAFDPNAPRAPCNGPSNLRIPDNGVDMGTAFDCFDPMSYTRSAEISPTQRHWRRVLTEVMQIHGFRNYQSEWWHFTFETSGPSLVFDFPITAPPFGREPPETPVK